MKTTPHLRGTDIKLFLVPTQLSFVLYKQIIIRFTTELLNLRSIKAKPLSDIEMEIQAYVSIGPGNVYFRI